MRLLGKRLGVNTFRTTHGDTPDTARDIRLHNMSATRRYVRDPPLDRHR
jgi:hypothetical protein